ncbi:MAG TPA: cupin domain-containing protein, partial [Xanthobacteraceae bacterium]
MARATATRPAETAAPGPKHNIEAMREDYYRRIAKHGMTPLWKVMKNVVTKEPVTRCQPVVWHYDDIKRLVMESGGLISAEEAERRVLILENPGMPGESRATNTLFAGVQMILPGEVAPAHRHVSSAIRFVLDGEGAYTAVEGEKAFMSPGDFVITANWAPHDHGNPSDKPMMWLDVLDFPAVNFFETSFAEQFKEATQPTSRKDGDSLAFYGSGVLPDGAPAQMNRSPVINYTYARTRPIVERRMKAGDIDKRHGARVRYANPVTGGPVLPTMGAHLALFPKGFKGAPYRSTDGTVFCVAEGK